MAVTRNAPGPAWWVMTGLALAIAGYALRFPILGPSVFPDGLAESFNARPWGIYSHALFGGIALLLGPFQFHRGLLNRRRPVHRLLGKVYLICCLVTGGAGLYLAFYSFGGMTTHLGFGALAVALLTASAIAYREIKRRDVALHREWMIVSYGLVYAAVTLRIQLPLLITGLGSFEPAYRIVAWSCWVPNLVFVLIYLRATRRRAQATLPAVVAA